MFNKKLSKNDLKELQKQTELINQYVFISQALEVQKQVFLKNILPKYGLDINENWQINLNNGIITKGEDSKKEK